jgi:signal transduction histidine kinase
MRYPALQRARFLIVDDEPENVRQWERTLELHGAFQIESTTDSRKALGIFLDWRPDMVLLDLHMPFVDGFALIAQFKTANPPGEYLPILVFSMDTSPEMRRRALTAGAQDLLPLPINQAEAVSRIQNLLDNRFLHQAMQRQNEELERQVKARTAQLESTLERLKAAQQIVIKQERLRALGMMASGIAHDFNNALTMVLGYGELMAPYVREQLPDREREHFQHLMSAAQDAAHVVGRLREFYRPAAHEDSRVPVDINATIDQALTLTAPRWRDKCRAEGIPIETLTDLRPLPPFISSAPELREVLTNLIFNAVDALPKGGLVRISTAEVDDRIQIQVHDNGVGMTEQEQARCLEPFYTTKGENGTGLGLAVVYGFVQRYGGSISIQSAKGVGTTVTLLLPASQTLPSTPLPTPESPSPAPLRILVVDDQEIIRELICEMLHAEGHIASPKSDGHQALLALAEDPWDILITDQSMPEMTGSQLALLVREKGHSLPIILLTGFGEEMRAQGGNPQGVDLIASKPLTMNGLREAVSTVRPAKPHPTAP